MQNTCRCMLPLSATWQSILSVETPLQSGFMLVEMRVVNLSGLVQSRGRIGVG